MTEVLVRRALVSDADAIQRLIGADDILMDRRFGKYSIASVIDDCFISIVAYSESGDTLGFASFDGFPSNPLVEIDPKNWSASLLKHFAIGTVEPVSTLFLNFFYADPVAEKAVLESLLYSLFSTLPDTDDLLFVLPSSVQLYEPLSFSFSNVEKMSSSTAEHALYRVRRVAVIPDLDVRLGFVEDHDDLLQLVDHQGEALAAIYGDYYLAELLERQDKDNRTLVAEVVGEAVGLMRISAVDFDPNILAKCFHLDPYDNLVKTVSNGQKVSNAFRVQLFTVAEDWESRCIDFLQPAFDLFPDKDYCIMTVPYTATSLEILRTFTPVAPRLSNTYGQALFVFHRFSLLKQLRVVPVGNFPAFGDKFAKLIHGLTNREAVQEIVYQSAEAKMAFAVSCGEELIGVNALDPSFDVQSSKEAFDVDAFVSPQVHADSRHCMLSACLINPVFLRQTPFFLRDTMRLSGKSVMHYKIQVGSVPSVVVDFMIPVAPRRGIETLDIVRERLASQVPPSILYVTRNKLLSEPVTVNNSRIVIVGASDTGLSIIYNLLMIPDVKFRNITLVSPHGLPNAPTLSPTSFKPVTHTFMPEEYARLLLDPHLRVVENRLTDFYRDRKMVVLSDNAMVPYDYLVLATGQQYKLSRKVHSKDKPIPDGFFVVRDVEAEHDFRDFISDTIAPSQDDLDPILVYGATLDAFCTVTTLLCLGVQPRNIVLATPRMNAQTHLQVGEFSDQIEALLGSIGVHYMKNHMLKSLQYSGPDGEEELTGAILQFDDEEEKDELTKAMEGVRALPDPVEVACSVMVYLHATEVDDDILHAVNYRALVFDGRLILKPSFKTEDPCVMAVGSVAKFSRRFGPSEPFELFNPREVATKFTNLFLHDIAPEDFGEPREAQVFPPVFSKPMAISCMMPGDRYLFRVWSPSFLMQTKNQNMKKISTNRNGNYICLILDGTGRIQEVQYLGLDPALEHNLMSLIGLPDRYLHNLVSRYEEGVVPDIVSFLQEKWSFLVFHDRFSQFREQLLARFVSQDDVMSIETEMRQLLDQRTIEAAYLSDVEWSQFFAKLSPETRRVVELMTIDFLKQNAGVFNMYHVPSENENVS
eukprot:ANDGO_02267.mRNA.1 hypothetical protein NAEGRDRAFT_73596